MSSFPYSLHTTHTCPWRTDGRNEHCVERGKVFEGLSEEETETDVMLMSCVKTSIVLAEIGYLIHCRP